MPIVCRRIPLLDVDVYIVTDRTEAKAFIRSHDVDPDETIMDGCVGCCFTAVDADRRNLRMLCVFDGTLNTAVHESVHMAWAVLRHCSIKVGSSNEEPMAYLVACLADMCMETIGETG